MTTITLTIPDDLAATLQAMPEDERNHFAVALMRDGLAYREEDERPETQEELAALVGPMTPEDIASLRRGFADADAGRWQSGPEALNDLRRKLGFSTRD